MNNGKFDVDVIVVLVWNLIWLENDLCMCIFMCFGMEIFM